MPKNIRVIAIKDIGRVAMITLEEEASADVVAVKSALVSIGTHAVLYLPITEVVLPSEKQ